MAKIRQINIENRTYYFYNDQISWKDFDASMLKFDKKNDKEIDVYYIGYVTFKQTANCNNINSVNPLYLMKNNMIGYCQEKGRNKYWKELQSNSVCSDESEAVSANSKTPVPKFLYEDCLTQIKSNQKNIHITKHFFSNGSFKIDILVKKTVYLYLINSKFTSNIYIESCIFDCSYS